jgi:DNA end-binding protein Ku
MAARSIASLSLSFGLVSIPIKLYSATESTSAIRFKLMGTGGARVRQQYVMDAPAEEEEHAVAEEPEHADEAQESDARHFTAERRSVASRVVDFPASQREVMPSPPTHRPPVAGPVVIERSEMVKGYEFERGKFVLFTLDELKALEEQSRQTIDIVAFIPEHAVDPIYYHKAYFLAPDKRGVKTYSLLLRAMLDTARCALAKWAFRSKEYVVQIRPAEGGMVLQQLLYADEVRSLADLSVERVDVGEAELKLAKQLIEQISVDSYDPTQFVDEEKKRILAAVEEKIAGRQVVAPEPGRSATGAEVVDLMAALRASLQQRKPLPASTEPAHMKEAQDERKPVKRAARKSGVQAVPAKARSGKR